jgi:hypothetical protein
MDALKEVSRVWVVAKMVYTLFESVLGNKALEERLQKAGAKRHHSKRNASQQPVPTTHVINQQSTTEPIKRKFDEMEIGAAGISTTGQPSHNMSYERSRPQTPASTPGPVTMGPGDILMPAPGATTPGHHRNDSYTIPVSRGATRPATPFNMPTGSVPATPPDLYLVTRSSPPIPASLWETFQPDQLFPDDSGLSYLSPPANPNMMDPQLQGQGYGMQMGDAPPMNMSPHMQHQQKQWLGSAFDPALNGQADVHMQGSSPGDDTWSNSSKGGIVPTTLNVEDWYVSFSLSQHSPADHLLMSVVGSTSLVSTVIWAHKRGEKRKEGVVVVLQAGVWLLCGFLCCSCALCSRFEL